MRRCAGCGSHDVALVRVCEGYWRMECRRCGSTGPFQLRGAPRKPATERT